MNVLRRLTPLAALCLAASASAQWPIKGILETYFYSTRLDRGANQKLTWGEFYAHPTKETKILYSFGVYQTGHLTDEAYVSYDKDNIYLRAGRLRTTFGFSDWANLFYNGFNSLPLVRLSPLSDGMVLFRQDSGIEATTNVGDLQIEVAGVDASLHRDQITPDDVDTGIVRLQMPYGPFIVGFDGKQRLRHDGGIYGFDLRYTVPHLIGRMEFFNGDGPNSGNGGYADVQYRLSNLPRTQLVGRAEYLKPGGTDITLSRYTLGVRQIFCNYFQLNVNYGWGVHLLNAPYFPASGTDNFSLRALFQIRF